MLQVDIILQPVDCAVSALSPARCSHLVNQLVCCFSVRNTPSEEQTNAGLGGAENGGAEKAIQDIDYMTTCLMADHNLPKDCWL